MPRIRILPDILANKIAAGEVVERPASVVKELVENAIDAQSDRIMIDIENGGRTLIQVADNGTGMQHDDALMSLERFATSKIHKDEDLFAIQTLGFRGEALPSIAAVSKMTLVTRTKEAEGGVQIRIEGGKILQVTDIGAPAGTMISVAQLFYNTPARRKFLKTINTELGHIADIVAGMALVNPQVHFKLTHNGKQVKQWLRVHDPAERAADILGQADRRDLIALQNEDGYLRVSGFLVSARQARSTSRGLYLYVNGRRVRDRMVQHALFQGYTGRLMKGQYPLAVLFLSLGFDQVDVNVHPTKHEIRFVDQRRVHQAIVTAVSTALSQHEKRLWAVKPSLSDDSVSVVAEPVGELYSPSNRDHSMFGQPKAPFPVSAKKSLSEPGDWQVVAPLPSPAGPLPDLERQAPAGPFQPVQPVQTVEPVEPVEHVRPDQQGLWAERFFEDLTVIGRFRGTYIVCQAKDDLILIDQHAAHERIVYEQLKQRAGRIESQRLLMPETIETGFAEAQALEELIPGLKEMGLEIEPFGGTTFVVKALPVLLDDRNMSQIIVELAEKALDIGIRTNLEKVLDECRMVMACHNAVRANQHLTDHQIRHMLRELDNCENSSTCPHGRPTWIRWSVRELEKLFKRTH